VPERYLGTYLGRFRVDGLIGSGGFAWVYRGYDPELEIPVAIKVLKPQFAGDPVFEERFRREASTAAKLRHPNIIRILAVGQEGSAVYFVMDYLPHGLVERLRIMGTFPDTLLVRLGLDVAAALAFAHREGVIHRDIKTDNIMFDEHGNAVVADFGIARAVSGYVQQTGTNMVVGTPQYFSPEQARGHQLDGRSDIYALGVTLFRAATGVLPFEGEDWYEVARQHIEDEPPKPRSFNPNLSRGLEKIILKCLSKDPAERFPTAEALQAEMARLGIPVSVSAEHTVLLRTPDGSQPRTLTPTEPVQRWGLPRRVVMTLGVIIAAIVAVGVGIAWRDGVSAASFRPAALASVPGVDSLPPASAAQPSGTGIAPPPRADTAHPAPTPSRRLRVRAPAGARLAVNGRSVGSGSWTTDTLAAGRYVVTALLPNQPGCPSRGDTARVVVRDTGLTTIALHPKPCGFLRIEAQPANARFAVLADGGARQAEGALPLTRSLTIPVGTYQLRISAPNCADFTGDLTIRAGTTRRERIRLICRS
jgi:serine/threonine-protein kinase